MSNRGYIDRKAAPASSQDMALDNQRKEPEDTQGGSRGSPHSQGMEELVPGSHRDQANLRKG